MSLVEYLKFRLSTVSWEEDRSEELTFPAITLCVVAEDRPEVTKNVTKVFAETDNLADISKFVLAINLTIQGQDGE